MGLQRRLQNMDEDAWPRVIVNTISNATAEPRHLLNRWSRKPRRSLGSTQGSLLALAAAGPLALITVGGELTLGFVYPDSVGSRLLGPPLAIFGVLGIYLDVLYVRRPLKNHDQDSDLR